MWNNGTHNYYRDAFHWHDEAVTRNASSVIGKQARKRALLHSLPIQTKCLALTNAQHLHSTRARRNKTLRHSLAIMSELEHRQRLISQLIQLVLWAAVLKIFTHVVELMRKRKQHEDDHPMRWICRGCVAAAIAVGFAMSSGDCSVLLLAVVVLGPLVVFRPVEEE